MVVLLKVDPWAMTQGCLLRGFLGSCSPDQQPTMFHHRVGLFNKMVLVHSDLTPQSKITQGTKGNC